ncbi:MAG: DUF1127 domain-containing protein [Devosia sp.]
MTTIDYNDTIIGRATVELPRTGNWLSRLYARWKRHRIQRKTLVELSHMDAYMLRDIGIDPVDVRNAMSGLNSSALFNPVGRNGES